MLGRPKLPVEVKGLAETLSAMRQFEPDLAKNLNKGVREALTPIQRKAVSYVPNTSEVLSGWRLDSSKSKISKQTSMFKKGTFPKFNAVLVRRGMKINLGKTRPNSRGFSTFYSLSNSTAAGAIMERAGKLSESDRPSKSNNPDARVWFNNHMKGALVGQGQKRGRLLYKAWNEDEGKALAKVMKALDATIIQFKRRADAQVFRNAA
jgi:hypothetical protein